MAKPKAKPVPSSISEPEIPAGDPARVAAELASEPAGTSTERVRRYRKRKAEAVEAETAPAAPAPITEEEIADASSTGVFVWQLVVMPLSKGRLRELDAGQERRLGRTLVPLMRKYLPLLAEWQPEIMGVIVFVSLIRECRIEPPAKEVPPGDLGEVDAATVTS